MIIFINIIGGLPANFSNVSQSAEGSSMASNVLLLAFAYLVYLVIVSIIVLVQDSYKKINIVSARQLNFNAADNNPETSLKNSYIPIKLNQGGIMPLVFSTTIATFLFYPL